MCGGTPDEPGKDGHSAGLSPRVRGNPDLRTATHRTGRSIPACAGEPSPAGRGAFSPRVYPRVCGGTSDFLSVAVSSLGLSPRVRGNRVRPVFFGVRIRSIPACAGEPSADAGLHDSLMVYPRVCGGTAPFHSLSLLSNGLSPRVRGNLPTSPSDKRPERSIPACAGEPLP